MLTALLLATAPASAAMEGPGVHDSVNGMRAGDSPSRGNDLRQRARRELGRMGISESGIIVGTCVHNGATHAYAMIPK